MQTISASAAAELSIAWLNERLDSEFRMVKDSPNLAADGERRLSISVHALYDEDADAVWGRRAQSVSAQLRQRSPVPVTLWVPPGADFPSGDRTEFISRVAEAASKLSPGQRGQVEFPVQLNLRKQGDDASYVHVVGGLAPYWARFTGRAYGQYVLDTTAIFRLPEPEQRVTDLIEWIVLVANGLKSGASSEIKAEDAWTILRPEDETGAGVIGADPDGDPTDGTAVRRALRAGLREIHTGVRAGGGEATVAVFMGVFRRISDENATIALRGCDPGLYAGLDAVLLVADGTCKPLLGPLPGGLLRPNGA